MQHHGFADVAQAASLIAASGAQLVVLSGPDAMYPEWVPALTAALKSKGARIVAVAYGLLAVMGLVPGLMAPTSSINTTLGCAITIWVYYHYQGFKAQGVGSYLKHFAAPPGAPVWMAPIMLPIELISHFSRVMSLSLRLFGNVFGEELVIAILFGIIPFLVPLPMMMLGLITGGLQAFIFMLLSIIYLQGAVAVEHHHDEHGHDAPHGHEAPAAA